jgi:hypothetical protein
LYVVAVSLPELLAVQTEAYQVYLEGVRAHPDDELLAADLARAEHELGLTWLKYKLDGRLDV